MRVLLAEDDADVLDVSTYALRKYGFDVLAVTDGTAAVQRWKTQQPDLVLLDVNLPGVNGMDVCREIRAHSSTPVIMLTAMDDESHVVEGFESGADDYVSKPVSYRELAMRMRANSVLSGQQRWQSVTHRTAHRTGLELRGRRRLLAEDAHLADSPQAGPVSRTAGLHQLDPARRLPSRGRITVPMTSKQSTRAGWRPIP